MEKLVMKRKIGNKEDLIGFDPGYLWRSTDFFQGPQKAGRYLVIGKDGFIREMMSTGTHSNEEEARILFKMAADIDFDSEAYIDDRAMTAEDLICLYRNPWGRWYTLEDWREYDMYGTNIHEHTPASEKYPLYFLDLNLDERIELDENKEIEDVDGLQYMKYKENCIDIVKEEE